ncbi:hypothetical protein ES288_A12G218600v1 [Gossypium darwinii]|uniref:Uncharacterized protein n=2 Tax=Gossypium TaxID=3633 RepID=A0A5D2MZN6_GOSTO|nr:hypothetical protein ES288_A12G218600v1 [Gossypium darwinii]TYH97086.1 hypothetical protein ES332_A12G219200v1 [Gossypium tomentosum]
MMEDCFERSIKIHLNKRFLRGFPCKVHCIHRSRVPRPWLQQFHQIHAFCLEKPN